MVALYGEAVSEGRAVLLLRRGDAALQAEARAAAGWSARRKLALMKLSVDLVKTSRGPLLDSVALSSAPRSGSIRRGVDVTT